MLLFSLSGSTDEEYAFRTPTKSAIVMGDMEENIQVAVRMRPMDEKETRAQREVWKIGEEPNTIFCIDLASGKRTLSYSYGTSCSSLTSLSDFDLQIVFMGIVLVTISDDD